MPPAIPPTPDLAVTAVTLSERRVIGNPASLEVNWEITNNGAMAVPAGTLITDAIRLSGDERLDDLANDPVVTQFETTLTEDLDPGESFNRIETVTFPKDIDAELRVIVSTDALNEVFEDQAEEDALASGLVSIYPQPRELVGDPVLNLDVADGAEFPAGTTVTLSGSASVPPGALNAVFVLDLSGSTRHITDLDANFDGVVNDDDNLNDDDRVGDLLDKEIGLVLKTVNRLRARSPDLRVAVASWSQSSRAFTDGGEPLDLGAKLFNQTFLDPGQDANKNGVPDFEESVRSVLHRSIGIGSHSGANLFRDFIIGPGNDFDEALQELLGVLDAMPDADANQVYFFVDGLFFANEDEIASDATIAAVGARGVQFRAAQVTGPDFVDEVLRIAQGVDADPNSTGDAVISDTPDDLDNVLFTPVQIVGVIVNGSGVATFDSAGNFFTPVTIEPGDNVFNVQAIDSTGNTVTQTITLVGVDSEAQLDLDQLQDITALGEVTFQATTFNRQTQRLLAQAVVTNMGSDPTAAPVLALFDGFTPPAVALTNPDGSHPDGRPFVNFDDELAGSGLSPGGTSDAIPLAFANAPRDRFDFEVTLLALGNSAPTYFSAPPTEAVVGAQYQYAAAAFDPDGDDLSFHLEVSPAGMTVNAVTGIVSWTPGADQEGTNQLELVADDGRGGTARQMYQINVRVDPPNRPPIFRSAPITQADSSADYKYQPDVLDLDGDLLQFSLDDAPAGMSIDTSTGLVSFPGAADGQHTVTIRLEDGRNGSALQSFVLTVGDVPANPGSPLILSTPAAIAAAGVPYLHLPLAQDPDGDTLAFSLATLPDGMTIDAASGRVDWTPADAQLGPNPVVLRVDDGRGGFATQLFSIDVQADPPNLPPAITSVPSLLATQDEDYIYDADAQDSDGDPLAFELLQGPAGMTIDPGTGLMSFRPEATQLGTQRVRLRVVDQPGDAGLQTFDLEVRGPNTAPVFTTTPLASTIAGSVYRYNADAADPDDQVTFSLVDPVDGMTIDKRSGLLTLTSDDAQIGNHPITIRAADERGAPAEQAYTLSISADDQPPTVSALLTPTVADPDATVEVRVSASDNLAVDTLALTIDGRPVALDASGQATFTSGTSGIFEVTATATDRNGNLGTVTEHLRVIDPSDNQPPGVEITLPAPGDTVTYLTDIVGSVTGADLEFFRLDYGRLDAIDLDHITAVDPNWITFAQGSAEVAGSLLGVFDPTVLANDAYAIRLMAQDVSGNVNAQLITLGVAGPAKLGQFSLDFIDLSLPLAGIPMEVIRRYSTFDAADQGDFGFGWTLGIADGDINETLPLGREPEAGIFGATPFRIGTRVYLTNPEGARIGFTFDPQVSVGLLGTTFTPQFTPDPGVYDKLEVDHLTISQRDDGTFGIFPFGFAYNPSIYRLIRPDGTVYRYDQFAGLQDVTDRNGNQIVFSDDGITHSSGESIQFVRDALGRITEIIDPAGNSIAYTYDISGDLVSVTDQADLTTQFTYFAAPAHYLEEVTDPLGRMAQRTEYDHQGRVVATIDALGNRVEQLWDPNNFIGTITDRNGNVTTLVYNQRGNVLQQTDPLGGVRIFAYDDPDNLDLETAVTDENGNTSTFTYDDRGNLLSRTDPLNGVTSFSYDAFGNVTSRTDPLGRVTAATYDTRGNRVEVVNAASDRVIGTYDDQGRLLTAADFNGNTTAFLYHAGNSNPSEVINPDGTSRHFEYTYFGAVTQVTDETGATTTVDYDEVGRPVIQRDALGNEITFSFANANLISQTDALGRTTTFEYDDADNRVRQTDPAGATTEFTYDANGNLTSLTDPLGNTTQFEYDALNRLIATTDPLGNASTVAYDAVGNQTEVIDRTGRRRTFAYDGLYRLTQETWFEGAGILRTIDSTYDGAGNLLTITDPDSTYAYTYDALDRALSVDKTGTPGAPDAVLTYTYDVKGNQLSGQDNLGIRTDSVYDNRDRLVSRTWQGTGIDPARIDFAYNDRGNRTSTERLSDLAGTQRVGRTVTDYDPLQRVTQIKHLDALDALLADYENTYDAASRLIEEIHHGQSFAYTYDPTGQLIESNRSIFGNELFTYDANGNRTGAGIVVGANNQIETDGEFSYEYDAEGNLITKAEIAAGNVTTYTYDHRNRLAHVEERSVGGVILNETAFTYDALNRRIAKTVNGQTIHTVYNADNAWADFDDEGNVVARYLFGDRIDENLARFRPGEGTAWYLTDKLGTVRDIVGASGTPITQVEYDTFGGVRALTDPASADRFLFSGRELDSGIDLYYYRARFYDPALGRFVSQDPLGFDADDPNLYRFVSNGPTNASDPTGQAEVIRPDPRHVRKAKPLPKVTHPCCRGIKGIEYTILAGAALLAVGGLAYYHGFFDDLGEVWDYLTKDIFKGPEEEVDRVNKRVRR